MIFLDRSKVPRPEIFDSPRLAAERERAREFFALERHSRSQRRFDWDPTRLLRKADRGLLELSNEKCAYCESWIRPGGGFNLDHFRPKANAIDMTGLASPEHYWWLAFEWSNLLPACQACNVAKSRRFPIAGERAPVGATGAELQSEQAMLLDPCLDDPSMHLVFDDTGLVGSSTERGQCTIEVLALNREPLVLARRDAVNQAKTILTIALAGDLSSGMELLKRHLTGASPYLAAQRQALALWVKEAAHGALSHLAPQILAAFLPEHERPGAASLTRGDVAQAQSALQNRLESQERQSVESGAGAAQAGYFGGVRRIERVVIEDFKSITRLELTVPPPSAERESWLMLVGENATGKISVLQAIALALLGQKHADWLGLEPERFVRRGTPSRPVFVQVNLTNLSQPVELRYNGNATGFTITPPSELVLLLGYGATRLLPRTATGTSATPARYVRVKNLFDPHAELQNAELWLNNREEVDDDRFEQVAYALKQLLLLDSEDRIFRKDEEIRVETGGQQMRLNQLSDGYQSVVALAVDIMMGLFLWGSMEDAEGVVLIDEIETHLHPRWKMEIVSRLRAPFSRSSCSSPVRTTHSACAAWRPARSSSCAGRRARSRRRSSPNRSTISAPINC